jgi:outer membrane lipoprotein-sorting protein
LRPGLPSTLPSVDRLENELAVRRTAVTSLRSFAQIAYEHGEENLGSRHAVLAERPDRFRLEVLSAFGSLALVTGDGQDLAVYVRREGAVFRGPATPDNVEAYTGVAVASADIVVILLGAPPHRPATGRATVMRDDEAGLIRLAVPIADGTQDVWFEPETLHPVTSLTPLADGRTLRVSFAEYQPRGPITFPSRIDLSTEPGDASVHVRYSSPSLNVEIPEHLFVFRPRRGVEERRIEQYPDAEAPS